MILLLGFVVVILAFNGVVIVTVRDLMITAPAYQDNLERITTQALSMLGVAGNPDWQAVRAVTIDQIDMQGLIGMLAGSVGSLGGIAVHGGGLCLVPDRGGGAVSPTSCPLRCQGRGRLPRRSTSSRTSTRASPTIWRSRR